MKFMNRASASEQAEPNTNLATIPSGPLYTMATAASGNYVRVPLDASDARGPAAWCRYFTKDTYVNGQMVPKNALTIGIEHTVDAVGEAPEKTVMAQATLYPREDGTAAIDIEHYTDGSLGLTAKAELSANDDLQWGILSRWHSSTGDKIASRSSGHAIGYVKQRESSSTDGQAIIGDISDSLTLAIGTLLAAQEEAVA